MKISLVFVVVSVLVCPGCGDPKEDGHVWQEQTDMLDKASGVEDMLLESNRQQRKQIDDMAR
jgi:hypothetical protein